MYIIYRMAFDMINFLCSCEQCSGPRFKDCAPHVRSRPGLRANHSPIIGPQFDPSVSAPRTSVRPRTAPSTVQPQLKTDSNIGDLTIARFGHMQVGNVKSHPVKRDGGGLTCQQCGVHREARDVRMLGTRLGYVAQAESSDKYMWDGVRSYVCMQQAECKGRQQNQNKILQTLHDLGYAVEKEDIKAIHSSAPSSSIEATVNFYIDSLQLVNGGVATGERMLDVRHTHGFDGDILSGGDFPVGPSVWSRQAYGGSSLSVAATEERITLRGGCIPMSDVGGKPLNIFLLSFRHLLLKLYFTLRKSQSF